MKSEEWLMIISLGVFLFACVVFFPTIIIGWQPRLTVNSPGSQLVIATDAANAVTCYRFTYHDGIQCFKNNVEH